MRKQAKPRLVVDADTTTTTTTPPETVRAPAADPAAIDVAFAVFTKANGALTKRIRLVDGKPVSDGSECRMAHGEVRSERFFGTAYSVLQAVANLMNGFTPSQALTLGCRKDGVLEPTHVVTKREIKNAPRAIARSKDFFDYRKDKPSLCLFDFDNKDRPAEVRQRVNENGGNWVALTKVLPELEDAARVERRSTSSCLRNLDNGDVFEGSGGQHDYILIHDGADTKRFLTTLHERSWLAGYGFGMVSKSGAFHARSLIDVMVSAPERLIFEAPPIVVRPLEQDREGRKAVAHDGGVFDTQLCKPLNRTERTELNKLIASERQRLAPKMAEVREVYIAGHVKRLTDGGMPEGEARARVERMLDEKELTGAFVLEFADQALGRVTVAEVLAHPDKYIDESLADPLEGPEYGRTTAIIRRRRDRSIWVSSFAHGGVKYDLREEGAAVLPRGFTQDTKGLWHTPEDSDKRILVCGPVDVVAETSVGAARGHGLLLCLTNRHGHKHQWVMPMRMAHAEGNQIAAELADAGLSVGTSKKAHDLLKQFFGGVRVTRRVRCVTRCGWHGDAFVKADGIVIGRGADDIMLPAECKADDAAEKYAPAGTLEEWQKAVARYAPGNDRLLLYLSKGFAVPLVSILKEASAIVHVVGNSRTGKSTLLRAEKSAWGCATKLETWHGTANGMEGAAAQANDHPMFLDELNQAGPHEAKRVVYMLPNSIGKQRANRTGRAREVETWNTLASSSGEVGLEEKLAEAGLLAYAGQRVRMVEIPADAGCGHGVWQTLHGYPSGADLSNHLKTAASTYYGTAAPAFLDHLTRDHADNADDLTKALREVREGFIKAHVKGKMDGQVHSVASLFGLIAAAGELATEYGVTGWNASEAMRGVGACFDAWLVDRGGTGAFEDTQAFKRIKAVVTEHGVSRFHPLDANDWPLPDWRGDKRMGFRRETDGRWEFMFTTAAWNEVCGARNATHTAKMLWEREPKLLLGVKEERLPDGRIKTRYADTVPIRGYGEGKDKRLRLYRVPVEIMGDGADDK
jgi:uncharacterized protein (DUF927 family)